MKNEIDFEAEARAYVLAGDATDILHLAAELRANDARARAEGKAEGSRRGVEAAARWLIDGFGCNTEDVVADMKKALLAPEPAMWPDSACRSQPEAPEPAKAEPTRKERVRASLEWALDEYAGTLAKLAKCTSATWLALVCDDPACPIHGARR